MMFLRTGQTLATFFLLLAFSANASVTETGVTGSPVAIPPAAGVAPEGIGASWETMTPMPAARVFNAVAADEIGYVYSIGGTSDAGAQTPTNSVFRYDTAANTWSNMANLPAAIDSANAVVIDNRIYVPGDSATADTYVYDIATDTWSTIAANNGYTARSQYQAVAMGTDVYVLGGIVAAASASTPEVWILDTLTETWSAGVPMQRTRTSFSAGAIDGELIVAGGVAFPGFTPDMTTERFDGVSWSFAAAVPDGGGTYTRWSYNASAVSNGQLWLAAGRRDAGWSILNHAGAYDASADAWTDSPAVPTLSQGRVYMEGAVASNGYFYVMGGRDSAGSIVYDNNERLLVGVFQYDVGGTVSGLTGSGLVLEDTESGQTINVPALAADYAFSLDDGSTYNIVVQTQPTSPSQTCVVANPAGTVSGADVTNVDVSCTTDQFDVGGSITGLAGTGLVLVESDSGDTLNIPAGATVYAFTLDDGSSYNIEVQTQPGGPDQTCVLVNATGTLGGSDVTDANLTCSTSQFSVGGSISGLTGSGLVLIESDSGATLNIIAGATSFDFLVDDGNSYDIQVQAQPTGQSCAVQNGTGTVNGSSISNVQVDCSAIQIAISTLDLNLGTVVIGGSTSTSLTLSNPGTVDLEVQSVTGPAAPFSLAGGSCLPLPTLLAPGESCTLEISFSETVIGSYQDQLTIESNATDSPTTVVVRGTIAPQAIAVPMLNPVVLMMLALLLAIVASRKFRVE